MDETFLLTKDELTLRFRHEAGARRLSYRSHRGDPAAWRSACREKLRELLGVRRPTTCAVECVRKTNVGGLAIESLVMMVDRNLSVPAYLLRPTNAGPMRRVVMALHGHGEVRGALGLIDDYHKGFAMELARAGHHVFCPELRGFGVLADVAEHVEDASLPYWAWGRHMSFALMSDAVQHGESIIGQTVNDLLRWEHWLAGERGVDQIDAAGISYGGDLAFTYPAFSSRTRRIFASGTLGSFEAIYAQCGNAPAHAIPGVLAWMDRADIAGLNAPRPIVFHYGELDVPGPGNKSASLNSTVPASVEEVREIYRAFGATGEVQMQVTPKVGHEMDVDALLTFLGP